MSCCTLRPITGYIVSSILHYNPDLQFLRLRFPDEHSSPPILLKRLLQDITEHKTIGVQPFVRRLFFSDVTLVDIIDQSLEQQLTSAQLWSPFLSKTFRMHNYNASTQRKWNIPKTTVRLFWSSKMLLPARNLWYRVPSNKVPHGLACKMMNIRDDSRCTLCTAENDFQHLIAVCPVKYDIWQQVLQHYYPTVNVTSELLLSTLSQLHRPHFISKDTFSDYLSIISTAHFFIWINYWNHSIDNVPFNSTNIKKSIISQIDTLLSPIIMLFDS